MIQPRRPLARAAAIGIVVWMLAACSPPRSYLTWEVTGEPLPPAVEVPVEQELPVGAHPWAGTVSHHLLTDALIDRWFSTLARTRRVDVFYVLSPSHWDLAVQPVSITDGRWQVRAGWVESDGDGARRLAQRLGVPMEPRVFDPEHGVSTLMPYIARHFPGARVVAVAYRGEPPVDQPLAARLTEALRPEFEGKAQERNFLLLSADFAHHGNWEGTVVKDNRSRTFLRAPSPDLWILVGCDNRPGIYALAHMLGPRDRSTILFHSDSWHLSGLASDDITSYFFTFFGPS